MSKASGMWAAFKEKVATVWKSGRQSTALGIGIAAMVLLLLQSGCGGSGRGGTYTGEKLWNGVRRTENEGEIYQHDGGFEVVQATKKGNLVQVGVNRVVFVVTPGKRYVDGERLQNGYYIRRGFFEYESVGGAERTVARYVEVTDAGTLQEIARVERTIAAKKKAEEAARAGKWKAEQEAREAERKAEEERREAKRRAEEVARRKAAEQGAYELDIPIKSLCEFKLGAPPSQIQHLLQNEDGTMVQDLYAVKNGRGYRYCLASQFDVSRMSLWNLRTVVLGSTWFR